MSRMLKLLLAVPVWLLGVWGSLKIHTLDLHMGHSICGPWGCGPPTEALIGYHAFWTALLLPVIVGGALYFSPSTNRILGIGILAIGVLMIGAIAGRATYEMWASSGSTYVIQKFFFSIATNIDVPMVQTLLAGGGVFWYGHRKAAYSSRMEPATETAATEANNVPMSPFVPSSESTP